MTGSNANRQRRLEIREKIERLKEQISIHPATWKDVEREIEQLQDELDRLELEYYRQTRNIELN